MELLVCVGGVGVGVVALGLWLALVETIFGGR